MFTSEWTRWGRQWHGPQRFPRLGASPTSHFMLRGCIFYQASADVSSSGCMTVLEVSLGCKYSELRGNNMSHAIWWSSIIRGRYWTYPLGMYILVGELRIADICDRNICIYTFRMLPCIYIYKLKCTHSCTGLCRVSSKSGRYCQGWGRFTHRCPKFWPQVVPSLSSFTMMKGEIVLRWCCQRCQWC